MEWELGADKDSASDEKNANRGGSHLNSSTDDRCGALAFQVLKMRILNV